MKTMYFLLNCFIYMIFVIGCISESHQAKIKNSINQEYPNLENINETIKLRSKSIQLSEKEAVSLFRRYNFYSSQWNLSGNFENIFQNNNNGTVKDKKTGLIWQQSGSSDRMIYEDAKKYIVRLNKNKFAGYSDWHLPTLEEIASLLEPRRKDDCFEDCCIDPIFNPTQCICWTADIFKSKYSDEPQIAWTINFMAGYASWTFFKRTNYVHYVRAVRCAEKLEE